MHLSIQKKLLIKQMFTILHKNISILQQLLLLTNFN